MTNSIDARVEFSFRGEDYSLSATIDLDARMSMHESALDFYRILAQEHHIDTISYLYEVMQASDIEFSNAQGLASDYLRDGMFDENAFTSRWQEQGIFDKLKEIAKREMGVEELSLYPELGNALMQAYQLGRTS